jgi:hypothetical protein
MSLAIIRAAFEKKLALMTPALSTAYENVPFSSTSGVPYQRVYMMPATPDNQIMGGFQYCEQGLYQISLCYALNSGPSAAETRAQALRQFFKRGTSMTEAGLIVNIINTPRVSVAQIDVDRYVIPVYIPWQCYVQT